MIGQIIPLLVGFAVHSLLLLGFLWIMIKLQKFNYNWAGLVGAAFLGGGLDMIPYFGHYLAVPVLYFCIWKLTQSSLFPDAAFTVVLAYALMFCFSFLVLTYEFRGFHATSKAGDEPSTEPSTVSASTAPGTNSLTESPSRPADKVAANILIKGVSKGAGGAMVTFQYGVKNYVLSQGEAVSITTEDGLATVRFLELTDKAVTLSVHGQPVKYALK
ncbi:MAG TPA: hypothetical protein VFV81_06615 [Verrucomicrobiae bacterium]|nr:hypothetical protein [Verrucomicrobiae bacterium]